MDALIPVPGTSAAKHMDVRERRLYMDVLILRAHGCAKAGFAHGCVYIGSAVCVEKSM